MTLPAFTLRTRILVVYLAVVSGAFYLLLDRSIADLRPRYLESMEEVLVDTAHLLASSLQSELHNGRLERATAQAFFSDAYRRTFEARIYGMTKQHVSLRVYVTDERGWVVYDSDGEAEVGKDYSTWRDVSRTLRGEYGARASRRDPADEASLVLHVAAPVRDAKGGIVGVVSVGKPTASINQLVVAARRQVILTASLAAGLLVLIGVAFSVWIATPIARLTEYAEAVRDGRPARLPRLAGREVGALRQAFEEMRAALEGKVYVERYVQSLTHELKSPISAIRGAAEILQENPPADIRARFVLHVRQEAERMQRVVDQLLQLATLEARKARAESVRIEVGSLVAEVVAAFHPAAQAQGVNLVRIGAEEHWVSGDRGLLAQALGNLLQNAIEFTPASGNVTVRLEARDRELDLVVEDTGRGIPEFALPRLFERFYSLPRPETGRKGTGLGLSLVSEIVALHDGRVSVINREGGGAVARVTLRRAV